MLLEIFITQPNTCPGMPFPSLPSHHITHTTYSCSFCRAFKVALAKYLLWLEAEKGVRVKRKK